MEGFAIDRSVESISQLALSLADQIQVKSSRKREITATGLESVDSL